VCEVGGDDTLWLEGCRYEREGEKERERAKKKEVGTGCEEVRHQREEGYGVVFIEVLGTTGPRDDRRPVEGHDGRGM
jgi:hypothetical protein